MSTCEVIERTNVSILAGSECPKDIFVNCANGSECLSKSRRQPRKLSTERLTEEQLRPPRENLIKQKAGYCGLYAILNCFETMEEVCQFLHIPLKQTIEVEDLSYPLNFLKERCKRDIAKVGLNSKDIATLLNDPKYRRKVGIKHYTFKSTNMDLHHLLASKFDESNKRYLCFGTSCSNTDKREKAINHITRYIHEKDINALENQLDEFRREIAKEKAEEVQQRKEEKAVLDADSDTDWEADTDTKKQGKKKRKHAPGKCVPGKCAPGKTCNRYKQPKPAEGTSAGALMRQLVPSEIRDLLRLGIMDHTDEDYKISTASAGSDHASLIYFNSSGVPFRYDPGYNVPLMLYPHYNYQALTLEELKKAVTLFIGSLLVLTKVFELEIVMETRPPLVP